MAYTEAINKSHKNPDNYYSSDLYQREQSKLNPISILNDIRYLVFIYPNKKPKYERIRFLMLKQLITDDLELDTADTIRMKLATEKLYGASLAHRGVDHSGIIAHYKYLLSCRELADHLESANNSNATTIERTATTELAVGTINLSNQETDGADTVVKENEEKTDNSIPIPAPKLKKGFLGTLIPEIARDLQALNYLQNAADLELLCDESIHIIRQEIKWEGRLVHLVYLLELLCQKTILKENEHLRLPYILPSTVIYWDKKKSVYKRITAKATRNASDTVKPLLTSETTLTHEYLEIRSIVMSYYSNSLSENSND